MPLLSVINAPWAIRPERLEQIRDIYVAHVRGERVDTAAVEAALGRQLNNEREPVRVERGVAIVEINGPLAAKANMLQRVSGMTSHQVVAEQLRAVAADHKVVGVILAIDSPGGTVAGTQELGEVVREVAVHKPVVTWSDGTMASAAYWVGSAARKVYISGDTIEVGSIGVVATHVDVSKAEANLGVKTSEITAGRYKRIASRHEPLSDDGRAVIQAQVDHLYGVFVDTVARNRGVEVADVLENMADGRVFIGRQAIDAGLVDGVATLEQLIDDLASGRAAAFSGTRQAMAPELNHQSEESRMDLGTLCAEHPELAQTLRAEGAQAERDRIRAVREQALPGHEALIERLMFDGATTGPDAAVAVLAAERTMGAQRLADLRADAPTPAPAAEAPLNEPATDANLPLEDRAKAAWDRDPTLRAEFRDNFTSYLAYRRADEAGRARVLSKGV